MNNKERIEISDEMVREFLDHFVHDKGKVYSEWEAFLESKKKEILFENMPCLSFKDICNLWSLGPESRGQLVELVNKKLQMPDPRHDIPKKV